MARVEPLVVDLDDRRSRDPMIGGAKAAILSRARSLGFPVLPGVVVPGAVAAHAITAGAKALEEGGSGAARLAVMALGVDESLVRELEDAVSRLGPPVVVRSSSLVEDEGAFAGAFSSFDGIGCAEVATALRGVWASPFGVDALERFEAEGVDVGSLVLAVLVQPQVVPLFGGSAKVRADGVVEVAATRGGPAALMSGWDTGTAGRSVPGEASTGEAVEMVGDAAFADVVDLARAVAAALGENLIEWAWTHDGVLLLQARRAAAPLAPAASGAMPPAFAHATALRVATTIRRFPGALGEALVLPWALGAANVPGESEVQPVEDLLGVLDDARTLGGQLAAQAWGLPPQAALAATNELCRNLRGPDPAGALLELDRLQPVDSSLASRAAWLVESLVASTTRLGYVDVPAQVWALPPERLERVLEGRDVTALSVRSPADRWEPFVYGVLASHGRAMRGTPVVNGASAGDVRLVDDPACAGDVNRAIIVARRPIPALSSLLWRAAGLVTVAGSPAAHLFEVATSVGVPTVINVDFDEVFPDGIDALRGNNFMAAIDGTGGHLWLWNKPRG